MPRRTNTKAREAAKTKTVFTRKGPGVIEPRNKKENNKRRFMCSTSVYCGLLNDILCYKHSLACLHDLNECLENDIGRLKGEVTQTIPCEKQWKEITKILDEHVSGKIKEGHYIAICENLQYIFNNYVTKMCI